MPAAVQDIVDRIRQVLGASAATYPLHEPLFRGQEWEYVKDCLDTGWVSTAGIYVDKFADTVAEITECAHAVPTVSGTTALHVALRLAGVQPGDEVIMPSLTFVATANAVAYCGATPHFIDCAQDCLGIEAETLDAHLASIAQRDSDSLRNRTTGRPIRAVVPVHIFGHPVDIDAMQATTDAWGLACVFDAAEALGSRYKGEGIGARARVSTLSFNGNKILTTGGGGAILYHDASLAQQAKHLTNTAKLPHRWDFIHDQVGYNYRMPNLNAALGLAQLEQLATFQAAKHRLAESYSNAFADCAAAEIVTQPSYAASNYWLNAIRLAPGVDRDAVLERLHNEGWLARPAWRPMHKLPMYEGCPRGPLAVSEDLEQRLISLPSSVKLGL